MGGGGEATPRRSMGMHDVLGCCFEGASERKARGGPAAPRRADAARS